MENLKQNDIVSYEINKGFYEYNVDPRPKILISTGTGIAPHLSLMQELGLSGFINSQNLIVIFGCRFSQSDYICKNELVTLKDKFGVPIFTAFSREQKDKMYVQHILESQQRQIMSNFIEKNFKDIEIYVCGNSKFLPKSIDRSDN